ncbi:hypothetical protein ACEI87_09875 [Clostridioides difficile]
MVNCSRVNYIVGRSRLLYNNKESINNSIKRAEVEYEDILNGKIDFLFKMNEIDFVEWIKIIGMDIKQQ